jgi:hypothetical protein
LPRQTVIPGEMAEWQGFHWIARQRGDSIYCWIQREWATPTYVKEVEMHYKMSPVSIQFIATYDEDAPLATNYESVQQFSVQGMVSDMTGIPFAIKATVNQTIDCILCGVGQVDFPPNGFNPTWEIHKVVVRGTGTNPFL